MVIRSRIFTTLLAFSLVAGNANGVAAEPEISASYVAALAQFLNSQDVGAAVEEQMTYSIAQQAFGSLVAQGITITEPMQAIIVDEAKKSFGSKFEDTDFLAKLYAPTYRDQLSEAELLELSVFWNSAIGQKMLSVNRSLAEGTLAALQEASQSLLPIFLKNVDARLGEIGITLQPEIMN